ncbi:MAG: hypothetical protein ACI855_004706, partial [Myxococcota bacterium]
KWFVLAGRWVHRHELSALGHNLRRIRRLGGQEGVCLSG